MKDESTNLGGPAASATNAPSLPAAVGRATLQAELDGLRVREKAHTREDDAIAAARRRLNRLPGFQCRQVAHREPVVLDLLVHHHADAVDHGALLVRVTGSGRALA
jgi:Bacterial protein of unknown function (DUF899)